jgi:hypothetical protein
MADLHDFAAGVKILLAPRGVFNAEVSYLKDMLDKKTFDSVYHEHIAYFSLAPLRRLFGEHGLDVFDAQRIPNHGGSLRIFVRHAGDRTKPRTERLLRLAGQERGWGLGRREAFAPFVRFLERYRVQFRGEMERIRSTGATIAGVGSPAKSVVLLNFCGLDRRTIDFIADSTPFKQGRLMPGTRIPIYPESELAARRPDYLLLLAWNYKKELLRKLQPLLKEGARVIQPFPKVEIL